jgi:hypothetical protein
VSWIARTNGIDATTSTADAMTTVKKTTRTHA